MVSEPSDVAIIHHIQKFNLILEVFTKHMKKVNLKLGIKNWKIFPNMHTNIKNWKIINHTYIYNQKHQTKPFPKTNHK